MMIEFAVSPAKNEELRKRMESLGVREEDIEESFVRSSGKGGQHVNKTSTCVQLIHRPTGIEVKCMKERSQSMNRFFARRELLDKIETAQGGKTRKMAEADKLRRQKSRRKRKSGKKYGEGETP
jgi:protein subunit release factor B